MYNANNFLNNNMHTTFSVNVVVDVVIIVVVVVLLLLLLLEFCYLYIMRCIMN